MRTLFLHARVLLLTAGVLVTALPALAQSSVTTNAPNVTDVATVHSELVSLRAEIAALRAIVAELHSAVERTSGVQGPRTIDSVPPVGPSAASGTSLAAETPSLPPRIGAAQQPAPAQNPPVTPEMFELLKAQIDEQAQAKVESASRMPVKLSGTILTNTYLNSNQANWLENPNLVSSPPAGSDSRGSMSATARQTRVGLEASGIAVGDWQASGTVIADFYGGVPGFQNGTVMGLPRLIYAFGRLETDRTAIQVGQDHVLLAPLDPTSLAAFSFPLLFRSGNLYLRAPQARVERKLTSDWAFALGMVAPIAGDASTAYEFAPLAGAGEQSMRPALQGRVSFARGDRDAARSVSAGVSGHYGWRRVAAQQTEAWAAAVDVDLHVGRVGAAGELYTANNAEPFGGGISQPGRAAGGWFEGRFAATQRATITAGFGRDRPNDAIGRVLRQNNLTAFSNVLFQITPELTTSLEYRWMQTRAGVIPVTRENHHLNAVFAVKF